MLVAVVKVTVTKDAVANGTAVEVVKAVTVVVLPNAAPVTAPTLRKSLDVATEKYWHGAAMMAPRVKPERMTVYVAAGKPAAVLAVMITCGNELAPVAPTVAARPDILGVTPLVM